MSGHDVWYLTVDATINGERRGFSIQTLARPDRHGDVPQVVRGRSESFLSEVVDQADLEDYSSVARGERCDWPFRAASYVLTCNGVERVRSLAIRPIRPDLGKG